MILFYLHAHFPPQMSESVFKDLLGVEPMEGFTNEPENIQQYTENHQPANFHHFLIPSLGLLKMVRWTMAWAVECRQPDGSLMSIGKGLSMPRDHIGRTLENRGATHFGDD